MATTHHQRPPFRAEHLGSLLRPASLLAQRQHVHAGSAAASTLPPLEDAAIDTAIALQRRLGFHALSDGEYRRHMFWGSFFPSLHGMREVHGPAVDLFRAYVPDVAAFIEEREIPGETVVCVGPVRHPGVSTYVEQVRYLQAHVPREMWAGVKLTVAAPNWYHLRCERARRGRGGRGCADAAGRSRGARVPEGRVCERRGVLCGRGGGVSRGAADPV